MQPFIYSHIIEVNEGENINEWSKKLYAGMHSKQSCPAKERTTIYQQNCVQHQRSDTEVTEGQQKFINEAATIDTDVWFSINKWSKENPGELTPKEQAFVGQVGFNLKRNRSLTYKQSKWALDILDKAKEKGWEK